MKDIKRITVIYNPLSTGNSKKQAEIFQTKIRRKLKVPVDIIATEGRGHARSMARKLADNHKNLMIVSASGDGGYNEIVNGVLESKNPSTVLGLLPAGNANDHYHFVHHGNVLKRIQTERVEYIDVMKISTSSGNTIYAHSYAGLGMTSQINDILMNYSFNPVREVGLVLKHIFRARPVNVVIDGHVEQLDNLILLNSGRMSKVLKNRNKSSIFDGKFEVVQMKSGSFLQILRYFFHVVTVGFTHAKSFESFNFICQHDMGMQIDGERMELFAGERVQVTSVHRALRVII